MEERMDWMNIARYFYLTDERLQQISRDFAADMERAREFDTCKRKKVPRSQ